MTVVLGEVVVLKSTFDDQVSGKSPIGRIIATNIDPLSQQAFAYIEFNNNLPGYATRTPNELTLNRLAQEIDDIAGNEIGLECKSLETFASHGFPTAVMLRYAGDEWQETNGKDFFYERFRPAPDT